MITGMKAEGMIAMRGIWVLRVVGMIVLYSGSCYGQLWMTAEMSIDQGSGNVFAWAATSSDYGSAWYYDTYVQATLYARPQATPWVNSPVCSQVNGQTGTTAQVSCSYHVNPGTDVDWVSFHNLSATYYWYQYYPWCSWDCYYYADAYGFSFLGGNGQTYPNSQVFYAPYQATPIGQSSAKNGYVLRTGSFGNICSQPQSEFTTFSGWGDVPGYNVNQEPYLARYQQSLFSFPSNNFDGRVVTERFTTVQQDNCAPAGAFLFPVQPPITNSNGDGSSWLVGSLKSLYGYTTAVVNNAWGHDFVGFLGSAGQTRAEAYRQKMTAQPPGAANSCGMIWSQQMRIACGNSSYIYGTSNMSIFVAPSLLTISRGGQVANRVIP